MCSVIAKPETRASDFVQAPLNQTAPFIFALIKIRSVHPPEIFRPDFDGVPSDVTGTGGCACGRDQYTLLELTKTNPLELAKNV